MRGTAAPLLIAASLLGILWHPHSSPADENSEVRKNSFDKQLIGSWKITECIDDGKDLLKIDAQHSEDPLEKKLEKFKQADMKDAILRVVFIFEENTWRTVRDGETQDEMTIATNTTKSPATLDVIRQVKEGQEKYLWIYKFANDKLILVGASEKSGRPTSFESKPGSKIAKIVLQRTKEK